jgi:branched-chain amino acid aminotransferase
MLVAHYDHGKWESPKIVPYGNLSLSPATSAIHYGQSCFEGMKAYRLSNGEICVWRPEQNFARINKSAERLCMPAIPEDIFMGGIQALVNLDANWVPAQEGSSLYIRPFLFATDPFVGIRPSESYTFMIFCSPAGNYYAEPLRVRIEEHYSRAMPGGTGFAKAAGNYAGALYPTALAQKEGFHQIIWTDSVEHKYIEEAGTMNVMFIIDGTLVTSPLSDTILKGVTRDSVLTLARDNGIPVEERKVSVDELIAALRAGKLQDAFGVGTAATFAPMKELEIHGERYLLPEPSELSLRLRKQMEDIRTGKQEDTHGWLFKI